MIRTRVGYCGGQKPTPTYYSLGDHTETIQIEFNPAQISYQQLLDIFWLGHNPTRKAYSRQYMSAVFYHNETQRQQALITQHREAVRRGAPIHTLVEPVTHFYWAEDYHQKYSLRQITAFSQEFTGIYPDLEDFVNSTAVSRVNGFVGGYGTAELLAQELESYGLSPNSQQKLRQLVQEYGR